VNEPREVLTRLSAAALLLDMDGTLVDSDAAVRRTWTYFSTAYGVDLAAVLRVHSGRPAAGTLRLVAPWMDDDEVATVAAELLARERADLTDIVATPGAHQLIEKLTAADLPWAVVTSADRPLAAARLGAAGITAPLVVTVEDVVAGKPDPEGYLLAASQLGVRPEQCLVVEDASVGVAAGRRAGMRVVGVRGVEADVAVSDLAELADRL
jgi:sugar-phosphatase